MEEFPVIKFKDCIIEERGSQRTDFKFTVGCSVNNDILDGNKVNKEMAIDAIKHNILDLDIVKKDWSIQQYNKIQDYVIKNGLYKGYPSDMSHADILIRKLEEST